jgi:acylphosphatase
MISAAHWRCIARGRVQGVGYRARVVGSAHGHDVVDTVANRADGAVFIDVQGTVEAVEGLLRDASRPRGARQAHIGQRLA